MIRVLFIRRIQCLCSGHDWIPLYGLDAWFCSWCDKQLTAKDAVEAGIKPGRRATAAGK